jgi:hypothetical protein
MALLVTACPVVAASTLSLNLPTSPVNITVYNDTESYFVTTLSNVPSGYDVSNATYPGWCIDVSATMTRNQTFSVMLYSSLNPPAQGNLSSARWDMVNYILNHKSGTANDTQEAIWYFINSVPGYNATLSANANATVEDALANGTGFVPNPNQVAAVVCFPQVILPGYPVQDSIIEVEIPVVPEFPTAAIPLIFVLTTLAGILIRGKNQTKPNTVNQRLKT